MNRTISAEGLAMLKGFESLRLAAYRDGADVLTVGYGHTSQAGPPQVLGTTVTLPEAERILRQDLVQFERAVDTGVKVPLTDNQFAALVSFAFNVGVPAFRGSTLLRRLNAGDHHAVPRQLLQWCKAGGRTVPGLANRRAAEAALWSRDGAPAAPAALVPDRHSDALHRTAQGRAGIVGAIGVAGAAATQAAETLSPLADSAATLRAVFVTLTIIGVAAGLAVAIGRARGAGMMGAGIMGAPVMAALAWLTGWRGGRIAALAGLAVLAAGLALLAAFRRGAAAERAKSAQRALDNLRTRVKSDEDLARLGAGARRERLRRHWSRQ